MMNAQPKDVTEIDSHLLPSLDYLARRRMLLPALLLLTSHAPLAFVTGQALWLLSPFDLFFPNANLGEWAKLLSHPQGSATLKRLMDNALTQETTQRRGRHTDESL